MQIIRRNILISLVILNFITFGTLLVLNIYFNYNADKLDKEINIIDNGVKSKLDKLYSQLINIQEKIHNADPTIPDNMAATSKCFPYAKIELAGETTVKATTMPYSINPSMLTVSYNGVKRQDVRLSTSPATYKYYGPGTYIFYISAWADDCYRVVSNVVMIERTEPLEEDNIYEVE